MKVIFFVESEHFTIKNYNDLYVEELSNYFDIEIWDGLRLNKNRLNKFIDIEVPNRVSKAITIQNLADLENRISAIRPIPIIITQYFGNYEVYNLIKKYNGLILEINKVSFHLILRSKGSKYNFKTQFNKLKKLIKKAIIYFSFKTEINPYYIDFSFNPLNIAEVKVKEFIKIHHIKYDDFLKVKAENPFLKDRYIVFIDSYLPYISDFIHLGGSINPHNYYKRLNLLFDELERKYNCRVVIAPHPKAIYSIDVFNDREIVFNKTSNLIVNSIGCVTHDSTSNITAILANKPLIFIITDDMKNTAAIRCLQTTKQFANMLDNSVVNLDRYKVVPMLNFNLSRYKRFEDKYIIIPSKKHLTNAEIIQSFIYQLHNKKV